MCPLMRIGILTGGGDCPALNAVIRAAVKTSVGFGWEVLGIEEGFDGLIHFRTRPMNASSVSGILHLGGTILGTTKDRKSTRLNSSHTVISYAVFCLKK